MNDVSVYSHNDEVFNYSDLHECVIDFIDSLDDEDCKEGHSFEVFAGLRVAYNASRYVSNYFCEEMGERSDEDCHEDFCGEWPNVNKEQEKDLVNEVKKVVDAWADKYDQHPEFYGVKNIKKVCIKITKIPDGEPSAFEIEWEIVESNIS